MTSYTLNVTNNNGATLTPFMYQNGIIVGDEGELVNAWMSPNTPLSKGQSGTFTWVVNWQVAIGRTQNLAKGKYSYFTTANSDGSDNFDVSKGSGEAVVTKSSENKNGQIVVNCPIGFPEGYFISILMNEAPIATEYLHAGVKQVWTLHPNYQVAFGSFTVGDIVDISQITAPLNIPFPGIYTTANAVFGSDGMWNLSYPTNTFSTLKSKFFLKKEKHNNASNYLK